MDSSPSYTVSKPRAYLGLVVLSLSVFLSSGNNTLPLGRKLPGINYNPRDRPHWEGCTSADDIEKDFQAMKQVTDHVRIYTLQDCENGLTVVRKAKEHGMTVFLGMWTTDDQSSLDNELKALDEILQEEDLSHVVGISVGSEGIYREDITAEKAVDYVKQVREHLKDAGITDWDVTYSDISDIYLAHADTLIPNVDIVMINNFPYWEGVAVENAVNQMVKKVQPLVDLASSKGKPFYIGETGWPSDKGTFAPDAVASQANQQRFYQEFMCRMDELGWGYYWFSLKDSCWRQREDPTVPDVECYWGVLTPDRTTKPMLTASFDCADVVTTLPPQATTSDASGEDDSNSGSDGEGSGSAGSDSETTDAPPGSSNQDNIEGDDSKDDGAGATASLTYPFLTLFVSLLSVCLLRS